MSGDSKQYSFPPPVILTLHCFCFQRFWTLFGFLFISCKAFCCRLPIRSISAPLLWYLYPDRKSHCNSGIPNLSRSLPHSHWPQCLCFFFLGQVVKELTDSLHYTSTVQYMQPINLHYSEKGCH